VDGFVTEGGVEEAEKAKSGSVFYGAERGGDEGVGFGCEGRERHGRI
jgi:hypothetical protein